MADAPDPTPVVTVFIRHDAQVLLLRRSEAVGSDSGRWGGVAGHVAEETGEPLEDAADPETAARREIREETGLADDAVSLVRRGEPFAVADPDLNRRWLVHPFLFDAERSAVETNAETVAHEWVSPTAILRRETVPDLWTSYDRVRPTPATVAADTDHGSATVSVRALETLRDEAAVAVERGGDRAALLDTARQLRTARPSMAVVGTRVDRAVTAALDGVGNAEASDAGFAAALESVATAGIERALSADRDAAARVAERLPDRIATLSRSGTVLAALERAAPDSVLVAESRPGREGIETAEALADRLPEASVTLTTDAALADGLAPGVEAVVVGADSVLADGRVVNKVGTRAAVTVAEREGIDAYAVAAADKVGTGDALDREEREPRELYDGDADLAVANPTFDATPVDRFDALITERGALDAAGVREVAAEHRELAAWTDRV